MKQKASKLDAKKAAAILQKFVGKDSTRESLQHVHHDKEERVAVATDGRILIATKHGYNPNAEVDPDYPNWKQVIPSLIHGATATVNPAALAKNCATASRLARAVKCDAPLVEIAFGKERILFNACSLKPVAESMAANGMTEMKTNGTELSPDITVAKNADATICIMPMRPHIDGTRAHGRGNAYPVVIDGLTGGIVAAPLRDTLDTRKALEISRETHEKMVRVGGYVKGEEKREAKRLAEMEKRVAAEDEIDALMAAPEAVKAKTPAAPAPAKKTTGAKPAPAAPAKPAPKPPKAKKPAPAVKTAPAPVSAPAAVPTVKAADDLAAWKPEEWKRLSRKTPNEARVRIAAWAAANATTERAELALMAGDYAFICNEGRAAMSQDLTAFRAELDCELEARVVRVYGIDRWMEVNACL